MSNDLDEFKLQLGEVLFSELEKYLKQSEAKIISYNLSFSTMFVQLKINNTIIPEAQIKNTTEDSQRIILEINPLKFWLKCPFHKK